MTFVRKRVGRSTLRLLTANGVANSVASSFTQTLDAVAGAVGFAVRLTALPSNGCWPTGQVVTVAAQGLAGSWDATSKFGSGTSPVIFVFTPSAPGSGTLNASASGMANSSGARNYTATSAATTFTTSVAAPTGSQGFSVALTVYPPASGWPSGQAVRIAATDSLTQGTWDQTQQTGVGTTPLVFNYTPYGVVGTKGQFVAVAPGLTNATGPHSFTVAAPTAHPTANRFDLVLSASAGPIGTPVTASLIPNGTGWNGGGSITLAGTGWTGATITIPASGTAPITCSVTPTSLGALNLTATNTAGLYNPRYAPFTAFASSTGTAQTLGIASTFTDPTGANVWDLRTYQRDAFSGAPLGFDGTAFTKGWGEYWVSISILGGSTGGLFARLYDADSTGATSSPGTGTKIQDTVQVYGAVSGTGTVRILLPASDTFYYLDLATDAAFTNPVRSSNRFKIGDVVVVMTRSVEDGWARAYPYDGPNNVGTSYVNYNKTTTCYSTYVAYGSIAEGPWVRHTGLNADAYSDEFSTGAQEAGRYWSTKKGVALGIAAAVPAGGGFNQHTRADGSPRSALTDIMSSRLGYKFRYAYMQGNGWTTNYGGTGSTLGDYIPYAQAFVNYWSANYPALAVICVTAMAGWNTDGSQPLGYVRVSEAFRGALEGSNAMVFAPHHTDWTEYTSGHPTWKSRKRIVRAGVRCMLGMDRTEFGGFGYGAAGNGPSLASIGTMVAGSGIIDLYYTLPPGASQLVPLMWANDSAFNTNPGGFTYSTPSATDMREPFAVYPEGNVSLGNNDMSNRFYLTGVTIDNTPVTVGGVPYSGRFRLTLDTSGGAGTVKFETGTAVPMPNRFVVHVLSDRMGATFLSQGFGIYDDRLDGGNSEYGWALRTQLDIAVDTVGADASTYRMTQAVPRTVVGASNKLTFHPVTGKWPSGATITITTSGVAASLQNGVGGGVLSGNVLTLPAGSTADCTVYVTPGASGTLTVSVTNSAGMTNPSNLTCAVDPVGGSWPITFPGSAGAAPSNVVAWPIAGTFTGVVADGSGNLTFPATQWAGCILPGTAGLGDGAVDVIFASGTTNRYVALSLRAETPYNQVCYVLACFPSAVSLYSHNGVVVANWPALAGNETSVGLRIAGGLITMRKNGAETAYNYTDPSPFAPSLQRYVGLQVTNTSGQLKVARLEFTP